MLSILALVIAVGPEVVVGVTAIDDAHTDIVALSTGGAPPRTLSRVDHKAGHAPLGVVINSNEAVLVVVTEDGEDARAGYVELSTGTTRLVVDAAVPFQRPALRENGDVDVVSIHGETQRGAAFSLYTLAPAGVRAIMSLQHLWATPVYGDGPSALLIVDGGEGFGGKDGHHHVDVFGEQRRSLPLGIGAFRSPLWWRGRVIVERSAADGKRAALIDVESGKELVAGRAGLSPVANATMLAASTSLKDATVHVWRDDGSRAVWGAVRNGVALPREIINEDSPAVVAWLDRGVRLPGELWLIREKESALLLAPSPRTVVTVYGVRGAP